MCVVLYIASNGPSLIHLTKVARMKGIMISCLLAIHGSVPKNELHHHIVGWIMKIGNIKRWKL